MQVNNPPLLSIVTPSYNEDAYIRETIESVFRQSYPNVEQIIVDGGSSDNTIDIIKECQRIYDIQYVSEPDEGQSDALNKGVKMANGEWIGWQNANDYFLPCAFEVFSEQVKTHPNADMIYGDVSVVDAEGHEINRTYSYPPNRFIQRHWSNWASNQSAFFSKQMLNDLGGFDTDLTYTMDSGLLWDLLNSNNKYQLIQVQKLMGAFRIHQDAKTYGKTGSTESVYQYTTIEQHLPDGLLTLAAKVGKGMYLLKQGRADALAYRISNVLQ